MTNNAKPFRRSTAPEVVQVLLRAAWQGGEATADLLRTDEDMRKMAPVERDVAAAADLDVRWREREAWEKRLVMRKQALARLADLVAYRGLEDGDPLRAIIEETDTVCVLSLEHREAEAIRVHNEKVYRAADTEAKRRETKVRESRQRLEQKIASTLPTGKVTPSS